MKVLTDEDILEAAIQILLAIDHSITITFTRNNISIRLPTTRKLADHLQIPHYYVLPHFATLEKEGLIIRAERMGISTTKKGSRKLIELLTAKYKKETESLLGAVIFNELQRLIMQDQK